MLMQKLPQRLIKACRRYWNNKVAAANCMQGIEGVQWDKQADLEHVDGVCIEINERNWESGGVRKLDAFQR